LINQFIEFLTNVKHLGLEFYGKYYSVYPGKVEDTNDPEQRGRIKISLPSILREGEVLENWCDPAGMPFAGAGVGQFMPPYVGEIVDVFFENGDINFPRYTGGYWAQGELPQDFISGYGDQGPQVRGWVFKSGQKILVDETQGSEKITVSQPDGSSVVLNSGTITITTTQDTKVVASGKVSIQSSGDCSVNASGAVSVQSGGACTVNAGADATIHASGKCSIQAGGDCSVDAASISLNGKSGKVLTTTSDPFVDMITGSPSTGVSDVTAG
jgi:hypothetical protein